MKKVVQVSRPFVIEGDSPRKFEPLPMALNAGEHFHWWRVSCMMEYVYGIDRWEGNRALFNWLKRMTAAGFIKNRNKRRTVAKPFTIESINDFAPRDDKNKFAFCTAAQSLLISPSERP